MNRRIYQGNEQCPSLSLLEHEIYLYCCSEYDLDDPEKIKLLLVTPTKLNLHTLNDTGYLPEHIEKGEIFWLLPIETSHLQ